MKKLSLAEAGALYGITANAMRARAKKSPAAYGLERDNAGKLWVVLDVEGVADVQASMARRKAVKPAVVKPSIEANIARLTAEVEAAVRARDQAESERDHWRRLAEALASRRRWRWW